MTQAEAGAFGLEAGEADTMRRAFTEAIDGLGLDGAGLFAQLAAGRTLIEALRLPAGLGEAVYARAHAWFSAGRFDRAEQLFRALCVLDGRSADHWVGYGICLGLRQHHAEAALAFATAAALRPDWAVPHYHAAVAAAAQGRRAAAAHLDAFAARADAPAAMRQDAERLAAALALRSDGESG